MVTADEQRVVVRIRGTENEKIVSPNCLFRFAGQWSEEEDAVLASDGEDDEYEIESVVSHRGKGRAKAPEEDCIEGDDPEDAVPRGKELMYLVEWKSKVASKAEVGQDGEDVPLQTPPPMPRTWVHERLVSRAALRAYWSNYAARHPRFRASGAGRSLQRASLEALRKFGGSQGASTDT